MYIIFDLDGTLFQTKYCEINAVNRLCDLLDIQRIDEQTIIRNIEKKTIDFLQSVFPAGINHDEIAEKFRMFEQMEIQESGILFPKVTDLLEKLISDDHSLFICSNGSIEYIELVLKKTGIRKYFSQILSAKLFPSKSELVAQIINNAPSSVIIGDTLSDIDAAHTNNIPSIAAAYGYGDKQEITSSTFIAQHVDDILGFINQIDVFFYINERVVNMGKKVIGISGVDTSGKTQFTNLYSRFLNSLGIKNTVLHIDDFHNPSEIRNQGKNEIDSYYYNAFNYQQVIEEVLEPLKKFGFVDKEVLCLNLDTNKYENLIHYHIDKETVLLIEGVLLLREPLLRYLDVTVFLQIDFNEVLKRAALRDIPIYGEKFMQKYILKYIPIQKKYLEEHNPVCNSDIVINNQDYHDPKIVTCNV